MTSPYIRIKEAAAYLGCHPEALRLWAVQGKVRSGRVGNARVFLKEWLDQFVQRTA